MDANIDSQLEELEKLEKHIAQLEERLRQNIQDTEQQQELLNLYNKSLQLFSEEEEARTYVLNNFVHPVETQLKELNSRSENLLDEIKFKQGLKIILKEELSVIRA